MKNVQLDTRTGEIVVGLAFIALTAVVVQETFRLGNGWGPSGPQPGFFPFISALLMGGGAVVVIVLALRRPGSRPLFESREEVAALLKVGVPIAAAIASLEYAGLYLMTAGYVAFFAAWYGRYRWFVVLAAGVLLPAALYLAFERGFRISLPKSVFYGDLFPF